jgi:YVTN family beta-propeller protein
MASRILIVTAAALFLAPGSPAADSHHLFESGHVRPLALSPSGKLLFAVNTPDNRLEVFEVARGSLIRRGETRVGLEPVAVAARSEGEVYVVNHLSDSVSVVDASDPGKPFVRETLQVGDEPWDVAVAGPRRDRVFVTAAARGQNRPGDPSFDRPGLGRGDVWVFDAGRLDGPPRILTLFCDGTRALAASADGRRVFAAAFLSGNRTTAVNDYAVDPANARLFDDGFDAPGMPPPLANKAGVRAPVTGIIVKFDGRRWLDAAGRDWTPRVRLSLPDWDVFEIDAAADPPVEIGRASGAGTVIFNLAASPTDGRVAATSLELRNHIRHKAPLSGRFVENRVSLIRGAEVRNVDLNPHIDDSRPSGPLEERARSLALPMGMEWSPDGRRLYLSAMGSDTVAVLDAGGAVLDRIRVGRGPTGLALDVAGGRLFAMLRIDHAISSIDLRSGRETERVPLGHDPEPPAIREGRPLLYGARDLSGHGDCACASCHIFGDLDGLAWDLGDPDGPVVENVLSRPPAYGDRPILPYHPMKGPMTTMSLRGLAGAGPQHWRGDANGGKERPRDERLAFHFSRPAFRTLLGRAEDVAPEDMDRLWGFVAALRYPPSPIANLGGTLTARQTAGKEIFLSDGNPNGLGGSGVPCTGCHALPLGTGCGVVPASEQEYEVPHLRCLYRKVGMFGYALPSIARIFPYEIDPTPTPHLGDQVRGFGFTNDGSVPTLQDFFLRPLGLFAFKDEPGRSGREKVRDLAEFLLTFPTGLAPAVGQQVTIGPSSGAAAADRLALLAARAEAGDGDLAAYGLLDGVSRGWLCVFPPRSPRGDGNDFPPRSPRGDGNVSPPRSPRGDGNVFPPRSPRPSRVQVPGTVPDGAGDGAVGEPGGGKLLPDRLAEPMTLAELRAAIAARRGAVTFLLAPPGSGRRIAIDRDDDGVLDGDE